MVNSTTVDSQYVRPCKICSKIVDFSAPDCDHETMEESAWLDMKELDWELYHALKERK